MGGPRQRSATTKTRKEFREMQHQQQQQATQKSAQHKPKEVYDEHGVPYIVNSNSNQPWSPSNYTAFKIILSVRLSAAVWSVISDCDETFNYWEPTHFLLYGKGFQTWEYSPEYSLRSYLYILIHAVPAWVYDQLLHPHRMYVFYFLRCLLALVCSSCELYFYQGVRREFGPNIARLALAFSVCSAGMFSSGIAFLPSTTSMFLVMISHGAWLNQSYALAIFTTALSTFLSWPFAAILGLPIAIDLIFRRNRLVFFVRWCMISLLTILPPLIITDSQYYGKLALAPFNIVKYNLFTSHGPDLYGTEPWYFYAINGFLNFNVVFIAALVVWPMALLASVVISLPKRHGTNYIPHWLGHMALFTWMAIFIAQPHKEERFLFPIYPLICLAAAASLDFVQKMFFHLFIRIKSRHYLDHSNFISIATLLVFSIVSLARIGALYNNYQASMNTWMEVSHLTFTAGIDANQKIDVCVGKEWHRFPSSFFLPNNNWNVRFLKSEFKGQLPAPYPVDKPGGPDNATKVISQHFNDKNQEEPSLYFNDVTKCDFIVDLQTGRTTNLEPDYLAKFPEVFSEELSYDYLDAVHSDKIFRAFFVPFVSRDFCKFSKYVLLKNKVREGQRSS